MTHSCPISLHRVDSNVVRLIAVQVIMVSSLLILTHNLLFSLILLFDFLVRTLNLKTLSPFLIIAKRVIQTLQIQPQLCDEAPKRFALYLGLAIVGFSTLLFLFGFLNTAIFMVSILIVCASLEALFDYCIGCKIYHYLQFIRIKK